MQHTTGKLLKKKGQRSFRKICILPAIRLSTQRFIIVSDLFKIQIFTFAFLLNNTASYNFKTMQLKITTFNCENLFGRYRMLDMPWNKRPSGYEKRIQVFDVVALEPGRTGRIKPKEIAAVQRQTTADAILEAAPDILAVQEVENLPTLRLFNSMYCKNYFRQIICYEGNDVRGIDVGLLIKHDVKAEVLAVKSHADESINGGLLESSSRLNMRNMSKAVFSRDCLEVDIKIKSTIITFLVSHFKAQDGKASSVQKRINQSKRTKELAAKAMQAGKKVIVLGDFNMDIKQANYDNSIDEIYHYRKLADPFIHIASEDLWSHYYSSQRKVSRLDYILTDKSLHVSSVELFRKGLTPACKKYKGERLQSMAGNGLEASDHCPASIIVEI